MGDECVQGMANKTRINGLSNDIKSVKDKQLPAIREALNTKVSTVFVGVGIFVLACILGFIYNGQSEISKDITSIKIEQSKVTSIYDLQEKRLDKLEYKVFGISKKNTE